MFNNTLNNMYHNTISRDTFVKIFKDVFNNHLIDVVAMCEEGANTDSFILSFIDNDYYIISTETGIIINWYKHLGRDNVVNSKSFTLYDLEDMLCDLKEELGW